MRISAIAAISKHNRAIGNNGSIPWEPPRIDMQRFKKTTMGHPVIMGRKTWFSIEDRYRPLSGRTNIVLSRDGQSLGEGVVVAANPDQAMGIAYHSPGGKDEIFIIGGGEIYKLYMNACARVYLTLIDQEVAGDTFFPEFESRFNLVEESTHPGLVFQIWDRK